MADRDCNSCIHHIQAGGLDKTTAECWGCLSSFVRTGVELPKYQQQVRRGTRKELEEDSAVLRAQVAHQVALLSGATTATKQSRKESFRDAALYVTVEFLVMLLLWTQVVAPLFNIPVSYPAAVTITAIFGLAGGLFHAGYERLLKKRGVNE